MTEQVQPRAVRSAVLMTVAVILFSPFPLIPQIFKVPVLWTVALVEMGSGLAVLAGVGAVVAGRDGWWRAAVHRLRSRDLLGCLLARASSLSVIFAAPLAGATLVAALLALSPASWALMLGSVRDDQRRRRFAAPGVSRWTALIASCGGCALVAFAQPLEIRSAGWGFAAGIAICVTGAAFDGLGARGLAIGSEIAGDVDAAGDLRFEAAGACVAFAVSELCVGTSFTVAAWLLGPPVPSVSALAGVAAAGMMMDGLSMTCVRVSVLQAPSTAVVAVNAAGPAFTVAAAAVLGVLGGVNVELLVAAVVVVAVGAGWASTPRQAMIGCDGND